MNTTEKDDLNIDNKTEEFAQNEESKPECKSGVCELNWHPKRPQAA